MRQQRRPRVVRSALVASGVAILAVVTTGCDRAETGSAAVVGDTAIAVNTVNEQAREAQAVLGPGADQVDGAEYNRLVLSRLVAGELIRELALREDVEVTQAEVDDLISEAAGPDGREALETQVAESGLPPNQIEDFFEEYLLLQTIVGDLSEDPQEAQELTAAVFAELSDELDVRVSPRYGTWDAERLEVVATDSDLAESGDPSSDTPTDTETED